MTTAHRPTFDPARGGTGKNEGDLSKLSQQYSSRDMPSHNKLKYRQKGQAHPDDVSSRDLRGEIEFRESQSKDRSGRVRESSSSTATSSSKKARFDTSLSSANVDADDPLDDIDDSDDSDSDSDDDAELMAELERIKKERAAEKALKEQKEQEAQERIRMENILQGNPLLNDGVAAGSKRRWDDDVVFKNCARGIDERKKEPTFINDAIRSDFHRKFMEKYIK